MSILKCIATPIVKFFRTLTEFERDCPKCGAHWMEPHKKKSKDTNTYFDFRF